MPTLNGVDLGKDIHIEGRHSMNRVKSVMVRSRNDTPLIAEFAAGPQEFDLVGMSNRGVLQKWQLDLIKAAAEVPENEITLVYDGDNITVRFRHWEGEVISATPLGPREEMTDNDYYRDVRIKLMEV